jgi:hypothetical protein
MCDEVPVVEIVIRLGPLESLALARRRPLLGVPLCREGIRPPSLIMRFMSVLQRKVQYNIEEMPLAPSLVYASVRLRPSHLYGSFYPSHPSGSPYPPGPSLTLTALTTPRPFRHRCTLIRTALLAHRALRKAD